MHLAKKNFIFIFAILLIIVVFLSLFFGMFDQKNNLEINQLDENMCKYHYLSLLKENFSNTSVILDIQYKSRGVSIFPNVKNIQCLGKVIDYEINFYEEVDNLTYVKLNLYVFTNEKIINFFKIFLFIILILISRLKLFEGLLTRNIKIFFLYFVLFLINIIFSLKLSIVNLIFDLIFYTALIVFIESENDKFVLVNKNHNISIDSLRAVAVMAVILNHFGFNSFSSGYLGVDLFFVISGYVITKKYINLKNNSIKTFYADFVFFRLKRIIPNLVFFILVTSIFVYLLDYNYKNTLGVALFSIFAVSNIYLYINSLDYFSTDSSLNSFTHTWSLGLEEQFYLIYPFLIYALVRKKIKKSSMLVLAFLSIILFYSVNIANPNATYYLLQYRFWQMALGCILIIYSVELKKLANSIPINLILVPLILVFMINNPYSRNLTLFSTFLFALIILGIGESDQKNRILESPKLATIGVLSYSLYLWHWPIISLSKWSNFEFMTFEFQILLMITLSLFSFKFVEQPFRNVSLNQRKNYLIKLFSITFIVGISVFSIINFTNRDNILSGNNPYVFEEKDYKNIVNEIDCYHPNEIKNAFESCIVYDNEKINVYLIGDSHSTNHFLSLEKNFKNQKNFKFNHLVEWGFIRDIQGIKGCAPSQKCIENSFEKHLNFYKDNLDKKDIVIFSFSRDWFKEDGDLPRKNIDSKLINFKNNFSTLIQAIKNTGAKVILLDDIPKTCNSSVNFYNDIILKGNIDACTVLEEVSIKDRIELTNLYLKFLDEGTIYLDPHSDFCNEGLCSIIDLKSNEILFSDLSPHISNKGLNIMDAFWEKNFNKLFN
jgi:peptidoglycan/LPS O-acetylase OafA/YrhL